MPGNQNLVQLVKTNGRPRLYPLEVDIKFIEWAIDPNVPLNKKTMGVLIVKYIEFLMDYSLEMKSKVLSLNGVRQHIYLVMRFMNWCMVTPATIDLQRCAILESMVKWFEDEKVVEAMTRVHPKLLINVDETQVCLRRKALHKVLWLMKGSKNSARVPADERIDSHLTLFVGVSVAGDVMKPGMLISKYVNGFNPLPNENIRCYYSPRGYMNSDLFYKIMKDVFVRYVETQRQYYGYRRAVLVSDGHISRFTVRTVNLFMEHNIDCVILPSHSSHVTQPLDLGPNGIIKRVFGRALTYVRPMFPLEQRGAGRPPKWEKIRKLQPQRLLKFLWKLNERAETQRQKEVL